MGPGEIVPPSLGVTQLHLVRRSEWCGMVMSTTYLVSRRTQPIVKTQQEGSLIRLSNTFKSIIRFELTWGKNYENQSMKDSQSQGRARQSELAVVKFGEHTCC